MGKDRFVRKKASRMNYRELRKGELQRIYLLIVYSRSGDVLVGSCYKFLWAHRSLGEGHTQAMAAGLTDHRWSMEELLRFAVPPAEVPRWRGRKPKWLLEAEDAA
jgi:hypothetical protein